MNDTDPNNTLAPANATSNSAWIRIPTRHKPETLKTFCDDIEAIIRVNPYYVFKSFDKSGGDAYQLEFENLSNLQHVNVAIKVKRTSNQELIIHYDSGIKRRTVLSIEPSDIGSTLIIVEDYDGLSDQEQEQHKDEVDKSLNAWGTSLFAYFGRFRRWSWIPGWRWYTRRVWIPMKPQARRITNMLLLIEVSFFGLFLFSMLIWWVEFH
ncbi:MAG: hypothetical protein BMS9Abin36_0585 [Gammaproteobacteria bacterium]|nr:MAG: hypothetical protein BMS9Abin36_0585 [Gammaproteobacteria bacterium]